MGAETDRIGSDLVWYGIFTKMSVNNSYYDLEPYG